MAQFLFEKKNIHERIVQQFIDAVMSGQMQPGQKLPSEVQLATEFQISRNILRESLKTLTVLGVVDASHGKGTYISETARQRIANIDFIDALSANQTIAELFEVRIVIEPGLAQLAAERRTAEDIERLWAYSPKLFTTGDLDPNNFHQAVADASGCSILSKYLESVFRQLRYNEYGMFVDQLPESQTNEELKEHRKIIECIINQDGKGARNLMYYHLYNRLGFIRMNLKGCDDR